MVYATLHVTLDVALNIVHCGLLAVKAMQADIFSLIHRAAAHRCAVVHQVFGDLGLPIGRDYFAACALAQLYAVALAVKHQL